MQDTMDFVAYVAKDEHFGRACHVLECGGGLAQDVITTIGQAFEIRFKQHLAKRPAAVTVPDRFLNLSSPNIASTIFCLNFNKIFRFRFETGPDQGDAWGEDRDYYNDRPGAMPPENPPQYDTAPSNLSLKRPIPDTPLSSEAGVYDNENGVVYDNSDDAAQPNAYDYADGNDSESEETKM